MRDGGDPRDGLVDGVHVELDHLQELVERVVLEEAPALHREVGAVELEHEAALVDQLVLLPELAAERHHVLLVRVVVGVQQDGRRGPRRDRRHEALGELARRAVGAAGEQIALALRLGEVRVAHLGHRLGRVRDARGVSPPEVEHGAIVGVLGDVAGERPPALAAEALHPPRDVGGKPRARLLAVIADVDARLELLLHDVPHRLLGQAVEIALVDGLAPVLADEQVAQHGRTRNAADVRDEDAAIAAVHARQLPTRTGVPSSLSMAMAER